MKIYVISYAYQNRSTGQIFSDIVFMTVEDLNDLEQEGQKIKADIKRQIGKPYKVIDSQITFHDITDRVAEATALLGRGHDEFYPLCDLSREVQ